MKIRRAVLATLAAGMLTVTASAAANASSGSGTVAFDNGQPLTANMWIAPFADWSGCGNFASSAVMNVSPNYITNNTKFYQVGLGSVTVGGATANVIGGDPSNLQWTNSNGASGSYISGSVCGSFGTVYLGADVGASAFYDGQFRTASTRV